jgi:hypothetical protein
MAEHDTIHSVHEPSARSDAAYATAVDTSFANGIGILSRVWHPAPGELVTLSDMVEFQAHEFIGLTRAVSQQLRSAQENEIKHRRMKPPRTLMLAPGQANPLDESIFKPLQEHCRLLDLDAACEQIGRVRAFLACGGSCLDYLRLVAEVNNRIGDQLKQRFFFHMPSESVHYYKASVLFGAGVDAKFPDARDDIAEAGRCFATDRFTACVFHLMRVMERGVQAFGRKLDVPEKRLGQEWGRILGAIQEKIKRLPSKTARSKRRNETYSEAWVFLDRVRAAWRNPTMHPKKANYTEEEARAILSAVETFMKRLATIV